MEGDQVSLCIDKVHGPDQAGRLFPFTVRGGPVDRIRLPVAEEVGKFFCPRVKSISSWLCR
jgi:hypothetical protein